VLIDVAQRAGRRSLVVVISDLFDKIDHLRRGLEHLAARKHDVIVFNLMDHQEREFTFDRLTQFLGMEGYQDLLVDPRALRQAYLEEVATFTTEARRACLRSRADFTRIDTMTPLGVVLQAYLAKRMGGRRG
jgi:dienelactone hydrolase